jgi:hypothetical protein
MCEYLKENLGLPVIMPNSIKSPSPSLLLVFRFDYLLLPVFSFFCSIYLFNLCYLLYIVIYTFFVLHIIYKALMSVLCFSKWHETRRNITLYTVEAQILFSYFIQLYLIYYQLLKSKVGK